jgi:hypothetical protein
VNPWSAARQPARHMMPGAARQGYAWDSWKCLQ